MGSNYLQEIKILIVEDLTEERKQLVSTLQKYFKTIHEAVDGQDAYEIYSLHNDIDLIISKIDMPNLSGLELLSKIRETNYNLPFIFISEKKDINTMATAIDLNINYYMFKPINTLNLLQKIDFVCEKLFLEKKLEYKQIEIQNYIKSVDNVALIFKMDEEGQITYMNKSMQEVSGYTQEDLKTLNFNDIIHPNVSKKVIEETWEKLKNNELYRGDTKFISKNKDDFYLNNTVFKTDGSNEYITVAFLTTQENLKKRDFYKKVIHNIQEANKKESEYKHIIEQLSSKLKAQESFLENSTHLIELEKSRALSKERQLNHYELQMENLNAKHEKIIAAKNEELKTYIESVEEKRKRVESQSKQIKYYEKELRILREKFANQEKELDYKNHRITGLLDLLNNKNKEMQREVG